ncbi:MAG: hypothetical protein KDB00_25570, partial [Planctomycetales bacterium]|nr:hypothetical protein [Planctomycetales bacterium]
PQVPTTATSGLRLVFDSQTTKLQGDASINVYLGEALVNSRPLKTTDLKFGSHWLPIADNLQDSIRTLTFEVIGPAEVRIDNVRFEAFDHDELRAKIAGVEKIEGVTIVTHGFQILGTVAEGDGMMSLARSIQGVADSIDGREGWLIDYDVPYEGSQGYFDSIDSDVPDTPTGTENVELVLLFDWSIESNEAEGGYTEAAGDALFNMLVDLGIVDLQTKTSPPLHFIAHSLGAAVTSEAVKRLAAFYDPADPNPLVVDQVTYLDPHDFWQAGLPDFLVQQFDLGMPAGYGASIWENVQYADVYYETRLGNGASVPSFVVPAGRPIPGAYNQHLNEETGLLPPEGSYLDTEVSGDHSYAWHTLYHSTVTGALPGSAEFDAPLPIAVDQFESGEIFDVMPGYRLSRLGALANGVDLDAKRAQFGPNFYSEDQDHSHRSPLLHTAPLQQLDAGPNPIGLSYLGLTEQDVVYAGGRPMPGGVAKIGWESNWDPLSIVNGDFEFPGDELAGETGDFLGDILDPKALELWLSVTQPSNLIPGWSHHAGGGEGVVVSDGSGGPVDFTLNLSGQSHPSRASRTHNAVYVDESARFLTFNLKRVSAADADGKLLQVKLGDVPLATLSGNTVPLDLSQVDSHWQTVRLAVPKDLRFKSVPLEFSIPTDSNSSVLIDNVRFEDLTLGSLNEIFSFVDVQGVTIITHGFQAMGTAVEGDGMRRLADAIQTRVNDAGSDTRAWIIDYDVPMEGDVGFFDDLAADVGVPKIPDLTKDDPVEVILLFDWAVESDQPASGWTEAAGDVLFSMLVGTGLVDLQDTSLTQSVAVAEPTPLHFIAHSFGSAVTSEAVERLAEFDYPVDQVTLLDPHDFDQERVPVDQNQQQFTLGKPDGYGATIWDNVAFADVYYQNRNATGVPWPEALGPNPFLPSGRPVPGAFNTYLDDELPKLDVFGRGYEEGNFSGDHSFVWLCYYQATIEGALPTDCINPIYPIDVLPDLNSGFAHTRLANGQATRPAPNFFSLPAEAHLNTPQAIRDLAGQVTEASIARWEPDWDPLTIINGGFDSPGDEHGIIPKFDLTQIDLAATTIATLAGSQIALDQLESWRAKLIEYQKQFGEHNIVPGWSHHGGGGKGHVLDIDNDYLLELGGPCSDPAECYINLASDAISELTLRSFFGQSEEAVRTHNWLYVPSDAGFIDFEFKRTRNNSFVDNDLYVFLGDELLGGGPIALDTTDPDFFSTSFPIPEAIRGAVQTLRFEIVASGPLNFVANDVQIDNVSFLGAYDYHGYSGDVISIDLQAINGGDDFGIITVDGQELSDGDFTILKSGRGRVLVPDNFYSRGLFYVLPNPDLSVADESPEQKGFQGLIKGEFQVDGDVRPFRVNVSDGYSSYGIDAVTPGDSFMDILRLQQRLRYLGFPGISGDFQGCTGDVIATSFGGALTSIDGLNTADGGLGDQYEVAGKGQFVRIGGLWHFLPQVDGDGDSGFTGSVSATASTGTETFSFTVGVQPGYSSLGQSGPWVIDTELESYQIQQRLRFFGFRTLQDLGNPGYADDLADPERWFDAPLVSLAGTSPGGQLLPETRFAIEVFNAATIEDATSADPFEPDTANTIESPAYLSSGNAPRWVEVASIPGFDVAPSITGASQQQERWATDWTRSIIVSAASNWLSLRGNVASAADLSLRSLSLNRGGDYPEWHQNAVEGSHDGGMDILIETPSTQSTDAPFYAVHSHSDGRKYVASFPSASGQKRVIVGLPDGTYHVAVLEPNSPPPVGALEHNDITYNDPVVLAAIKDLIVDNPDISYNVNKVREQIRSFLQVPGVTRVVYNDPRIFTDATLPGTVQPYREFADGSYIGPRGAFQVDVAPP